MNLFTQIQTETHIKALLDRITVQMTRIARLRAVSVWSVQSIRDALGRAWKGFLYAVFQVRLMWLFSALLCFCPSVVAAVSKHDA